MTEEIQGQIEKITFYNEEDHYTIAKAKIKGKNNLVTVVGILPSASAGEILKMTGSWQNHPKYGEQFKIVSYETVIPATLHGIERYLGSGLIKGVGPVMAKRLVEKFGTKTIDIIETDIDQLRLVEGIGDKRMEMISSAWAGQKEIRDVMLFLQNHEVSPAYASKIYRQYGKQAIHVIKENPYRLAEDIFGIGFITADKIATKLGMPKDSQVRAEAGIIFLLNKLADEGHVYYPNDELMEEAVKMLNMDAGVIAASIKKIAAEKKIVIDKGAVYLTRYYDAESSIADRLKKLLSASENLLRHNEDKTAELIHEKLDIRLSESQTAAVKASLSGKALVITGGPGTGKTTIIKAVISIHQRLGHRILLAAPTGRASKRMSEATGYEAKTIHRLLEYSPKTGGFKRNNENPLDADMIILDEVSMVDTLLMNHLLKAVPESASLIFVGDVDQLPSVGAGNILRDIIDSGVIHTVKLNEIFRQAGDSLIVSNAHRINSGEFPQISFKKDVVQDFYFIDVEDPEKVCETIINMCGEKIPGRFGFHPIDDIQVLAPMHRGTAGASNLNIELQKNLNPSMDELLRGGRTFKTGDKVMQIKNNYDKEVFNGDIGRIVNINREEQNLTVDYEGRKVVYDFNELDELMTAYAISVHKSQGSEYKAVVMPLLTQHYLMLQRNLLYTAVTRGKKLVVIIGTKKALNIAIRNNRVQTRYTMLKERLTGQV